MPFPKEKTESNNWIWKKLTCWVMLDLVEGSFINSYLFSARQTPHSFANYWYVRIIDILVQRKERRLGDVGGWVVVTNSCLIPYSQKGVAWKGRFRYADFCFVVNLAVGREQDLEHGSQGSSEEAMTVGDIGKFNVVCNFSQSIFCFFPF